jgi:hypothetical protein
MSTVDMFEPVVTFDSLVRALARALGSETRAGCLETPEANPPVVVSASGLWQPVIDGLRGRGEPRRVGRAIARCRCRCLSADASRSGRGLVDMSP